MDATQLRGLFRRVMLVSLAAPAVGGCGGVVTSTTGDAAAADSGVTSDTFTPPEDVMKPETCNATPIKHDVGACSFLVDYPCGLPGGLPGEGPLTNEQCMKLCDSTEAFSCFVDRRDTGVAGNVTLNCQICAVGRRPAGLCDEEGARASNEVGDFFARAAELEAASIDAFRVLRDELTEHGAPRALVLDAERAARDEVRHARAMARIARNRGGRPRKLRIEKAKERTLEQIAMENAIEGCVRETFGALLATHQAEHATDGFVARAMKKIAIDETRHAALAWSVARFLDTKLDEDARVRIARAREAAVARLIDELQGPTASTLITEAGFPDTPRARRLAEEMRSALWA